MELPDGSKIGEYDRKRDEEAVRLRYDLCDPHMGIGALSQADLIETPMAVMRQGQRAAEELQRLRRIVDHIATYYPHALPDE